MPRNDPERLSTGIPGLDAVLHGGLLRGRLHFVLGAPGTGKTVFTTQIAFARAHAGEKVIFLSLLAESNTTLISNFRSFAFFRASYIPSRIQFLSGFPALDESGLPGLGDFLRTLLQKNRPRLLIVDSLAAVKEAATTTLELKRFLRELTTSAFLLGCTPIATVPRETGGPHSEDAVADGLYELRRTSAGMRVLRTLEVLKMRGSSHLAGKHVFQIAREGMQVTPRLEALITEAPPKAPARITRERFGIAALDEMLHGGLPTATSTVLLGGPGCGKTMLGLHFLSEGARWGKRGLYFGFYETPPRIVLNGQKVGLPLARWERDQLLQFCWQPPLEQSPDELAHRLLEAVERFRIDRLFIDGIDGFKIASFHPRRLSRFFAALTNRLRAMGVTTALTEETDFISPVISRSGAGPSAIYENLILLRFVELRSQLHRLISILKMRDSDYDNSIREFQITSGGVLVTRTFHTAEALLSGQARPAGTLPPAAAPPPRGS